MRGRGLQVIRRLDPERADRIERVDPPEPLCSCDNPDPAEVTVAEQRGPIFVSCQRCGKEME